MPSPVKVFLVKILQRNLVFEDCPIDFRRLFYLRYVDNTFLVFRKRDDVEPFFNYLNSKHSNIKFTKEHENENKLSSLDVKIKKGSLWF